MSLVFKELYNLYHDYGSKTGLARSDVLYKSAKEQNKLVTRKDVLDFLATQDAHTLHVPVIRNFSRNRIKVDKIDHVWQLDLADMQNISQYNNGFRYLLLAIDVLSKIMYVEPIKNKESISVTLAFDEILKRSKPRIPDLVNTDKGQEFMGREFQKFLSECGIGFYTTENSEIKAAIAERAIRTLKSKIWKFFTARNTRRYIDVLQDIVQAYNQSTHRTIGLAPNDVTEANQQKVWERVYNIKKPKPNKKTFKVGDHVRLSRALERFGRGFQQGWTREIFEIVRKIPRKPYPVYQLKDQLGEVIVGTFYTKELERVTIQPETLYHVESILKTRKRRGKTEYFVKFLGYDERFNAWVDSLEHV